jgi:hypothetical protein
MYCEWLILTAILVTKLGLRDGEDEETTARADGKTPLAKAIWQMAVGLRLFEVTSHEDVLSSSGLEGKPNAQESDLRPQQS